MSLDSNLDKLLDAADDLVTFANGYTSYIPITAPSFPTLPATQVNPSVQATTFTGNSLSSEFNTSVSTVSTGITSTQLQLVGNVDTSGAPGALAATKPELTQLTAPVYDVLPPELNDITIDSFDKIPEELTLPSFEPFVGTPPDLDESTFDANNPNMDSFVTQDPSFERPPLVNAGQYDLSAPEAPSLSGVTAPSDKPNVRVPPFTKTVNPFVQKTAIPNIGDFPLENWLQQFYSTPFWNQIRDYLSEEILNGRLGIKLEDEIQIWQRQIERNQIAFENAIRAVNYQFSRLRFGLPPGKRDSKLRELGITSAYERNNLSREVALEQAKMTQAWKQFAVQQGIEVEKAQMAYVLKVAELAHAIAMKQVEVSLQILNTELEVYKTTLEEFKAYVLLFETQVKVQLADIERYKAEIEVMKAETQVDLAKVEIYKAQISAKQTLAEILKTQFQNYEVQLKANALNVEIYAKQIEAFKAATDAYGAQLDAFKAQKGINELTTKIYAEEVNAYKVLTDAKVATIQGELGKVQAFKAEVDAYLAQIEGKKAEATVETLKAQVFKSKVDAFSAEVQAFNSEVTNNEALVKNYSAGVQAYTSEMEGYKAKIEGEKAKITAIDFRNKAELDKLSKQLAVLQLAKEKFNATVDAYKAGVVNEAELKRFEMQKVETNYRMEQVVKELEIKREELNIQVAKANKDLAVSGDRWQAETDVQALKAAGDLYKGALAPYIDGTILTGKKV